MLKLYEMADQYKELFLLAEHAGDEAEMQAFADTLEALQGEISVKIEQCAMVVKTIEGNANAIECEVDRLDERRKSLRNSAARIKTYMQTCMTDAQIDKVKGVKFTVSIQNNPPAVHVLDQALIPDRFWRVVREPSTSAIAETLKIGLPVEGCELTQGKSLRIR